MLPRLLLACACLLPVACTGPYTVVHNPGGHRVFVDGVEVPMPTATAARPPSDAPHPVDGTALPFRYYGTSRYDAIPGDRDGEPDWLHQSTSVPIVMPPPVSLWLFPIDFPLELTRRLIAGREDIDVQVVLPATPAELVAPKEVAPPGLGQLVQRAAAARIER